jgi:hypothetical protein
MTSMRFLTATLVLACTSHGLVVPDARPSLRYAPASLSSSLSSNNDGPSNEAIRRDIEVMREEAKQRLQSLSLQMEDMLEKHSKEASVKPESSSFLDASAFEKAELPVVQVEKTQEKLTGAVTSPPTHVSDSTLLHGTRWKAVIQVGGARQTDEKPLLIHLVIDFTSDTLQDNDDLLRSGFGTSPAKILRVKESWVGASSWTEGRQRNVPVKGTGGWKVLPGQGPKGIDILRFYIDVEEEICHDKEHSTLKCPARRVYCTSGFFSMNHHSESEAYKDYLRGELDRLVNKYDDLTIEDEADEHFFSMEKVKRAKHMMDLRKQIKATNELITQARIRDPEKAMLRLSRKGDCGVTKEGQVCYKEIKGVSAEYLALGKMEMASINKPIVESSSAADSSALRP